MPYLKLLVLSKRLQCNDTESFLLKNKPLEKYSITVYFVFVFFFLQEPWLTL